MHYHILGLHNLSKQQDVSAQNIKLKYNQITIKQYIDNTELQQALYITYFTSYIYSATNLPYRVKDAEKILYSAKCFSWVVTHNVLHGHQNLYIIKF